VKIRVVKGNQLTTDLILSCPLQAAETTIRVLVTNYAKLFSKEANDSPLSLGKLAA